MSKRIISLVIGLAICVSSLTFGIVIKKASDSNDVFAADSYEGRSSS